MGLFSLALTTSCVSRAPPPELNGDRLGDGYAKIRESRLAGRGDLEGFGALGPVGVTLERNATVTLPGGAQLVFDNLIPKSASPTPLIVLVHGNRSRKEAHRRQAELLASHGMHAVAVDVPNRSRWLANGRLIRALVDRVRQAPRLLGGHIDPARIVLVGHSFGGSAVTLAAAQGAKVKGLILLDPAVFSTAVERAMATVEQPVLVIGADRDVFRARKRGQFFRRLGGDVLELSVAGATHDDAQHPSMYALTTIGIDPFTSTARQGFFAATLAAGAFSLAATGTLDYVREALEPELARGILKDLRVRTASASGEKAP